MKKFILFLIIITLLISSSFARVFTDISNHWAEFSILMAYHNQLLSGYSDGTFLPNNTITRAEFVTILAKVLDSSIDIYIDETEELFTYGDLPDTHWAKPFFNKLIYYGYVFSEDNSLDKYKGRDFITDILGYSFNPSEPITRAEAVSLIAYFLDDSKLDNESNLTLSDIDTSELKEYINKFCKTGIIKGYNDGTFKPNNTITRAEVAKIIYDIYCQKHYFKQTNWINEVSISTVYNKPLTPENVFITFLRHEKSEDFHYAYQFLSAKYKVYNEVYNYKDYMKNTKSHIMSNYTGDLYNDIELEKKENKDGSVTLSYTDLDKQTHSIDLILAGDKWYINSKIY